MLQTPPFLRAGAGLVGCLVAGALLAASQGSGPTPQAYRSLPFRFIGPTGNRVVALAGIPGDPSIIYAGAASGGIFKTTDAGLHWRPIFDEYGVASIGALAVARSNPDVVWAGTGEVFIRGNISIGNGLYKSTDAGKTWVRSGLDRSGRIARIAIHPTNPDIVYAAALGHCYGPQPERGVFRTADGGRTWDRVLFVDENTGAVDLVMDPSAPDTLFAAMWQFAIYPWYSVSGGPGSGLHVSRDGGLKWTALTGRGLPAPPLGRIGLGIAPSNPKRIYATIETADQGNLWRSDDGGERWALISRDRAINNRARYFSRLGVVPDNPDEVYFLTQRLMRSLDGGATTAAVPEVYPDQHDIWIDPLNGNRQIVANDRYVNLSVNRGRSWFRAGLPIAQIYRVATDTQVPYNVFGARQDGPTYRGPSNSLLGTGQIPADLWEYAGWNESGYGRLRQDLEGHRLGHSRERLQLCARRSRRPETPGIALSRHGECAVRVVRRWRRLAAAAEQPAARRGQRDRGPGRLQRSRVVHLWARVLGSGRPLAAAAADAGGHRNRLHAYGRMLDFFKQHLGAATGAVASRPPQRH